LAFRCLGKPSIDRAQHLAGIKVPMLFVQGTRDEMADAGLIERLSRRCAPPPRCTGCGGNHPLHVPAIRPQHDQVPNTALDAARVWISG
jgi:hypothetical protein